MATNSTNDTIQIRYSDPITLYVYSGIDNFGNSNFGGYHIYVVKVPTGETPYLNSSGITIGRRLEHVRTIYPEVDVSYSGRTNKVGTEPIQRLVYSPSFIYPVDYYVSEEGFDHYFYLSAFDKKGNVSSGLIAYSNNPLRGPSIQSRAIQFANAQSAVTIYNSGTLFPLDSGGAYPSGSISFWVTTPNSENPSASNDYGIFDKVNGSNRPAPIAIHVESTGTGHPYIRFLIGVGGSSSGGAGTSYEFWETSTLEFNKKYHVVCVWSGVSATTMRATIYLNGVSNISSNKTISAGMPNGPTGGSNPTIGYVSGRLDSWSGLIVDGVHIYNIPLDSTQVTTLYSGQIHGIEWSYLPDNILTKFSFDEGSGLITYADYPVLTPEISGVMTGDIRWVRPLYIELRQTSLNSNIVQFINTYIVSGELNSGVVEYQNLANNAQDLMFTSSGIRNQSEDFAAVYIDTDGTLLPSTITATDINFSNRIFTSSTTKTQVEALNNNGVVANYKVPTSAVLFAKTHGNLIPKAYSELESVPTIGVGAGSPTVSAAAGYRGKYGISAVASDVFYLGPSSSSYNISGLSPNGATTLYFILSCMCYSTSAGSKANVTIEDSAATKFLNSKALSDTVAKSWTRVYTPTFSADSNNPIKISFDVTDTAYFDDFMLEQVNDPSVTEPGEFKPGDGKNSLPYTDFVSGELNYFTRVTNGWGYQPDGDTVRVRIGNVLDLFTETTDSVADGPFLLLPTYSGFGGVCPLIPSGAVYVITESGYNGIWYSDGNGNCYDSLGYNPTVHKEVNQTPASSYAKMATTNSEIERFLYFTTRR